MNKNNKGSIESLILKIKKNANSEENATQTMEAISSDDLSKNLSPEQGTSIAKDLKIDELDKREREALYQKLRDAKKENSEINYEEIVARITEKNRIYEEQAQAGNYIDIEQMQRELVKRKELLNTINGSSKETIKKPITNSNSKALKKPEKIQKNTREGKAKLLYLACISEWNKVNTLAPISADQLILYCIEHSPQGYKDIARDKTKIVYTEGTTRNSVQWRSFKEQFSANKSD